MSNDDLKKEMNKIITWLRVKNKLNRNLDSDAKQELMNKRQMSFGGDEFSLPDKKNVVRESLEFETPRLGINIP